MENFTWEDVFVDIPGEYFFEGKKEYISKTTNKWKGN
jgi:hypothetical protein